MFVSIKGGSYANFQRALKGGNLTMIRAAATELPAINLEDALRVCVVVADERPDLFEKAALRWSARYCLERKDASLDGLRQAAEAFARLDADREEALATLHRLSRL